MAYDRRVNLVFRSVAIPNVPEFEALANAQKVYDQFNIKLEFAGGMSMLVQGDDQISLDAADGTCNWNQASYEQTLLNNLGGRLGVGADDVLVYYVNRIVQKDGSKLNGCAGHLPDKPTVVVSSVGSRWTLGHELCHVLLGPSFTPVHSSDKTNLMFTPTNNITADPPGLTAEQRAAVRSSKYCKAI